MPLRKIRGPLASPGPSDLRISLNTGEQADNTTLYNKERSLIVAILNYSTHWGWNYLWAGIVFITALSSKQATLTSKKSDSSRNSAKDRDKIDSKSFQRRQSSSLGAVPILISLIFALNFNQNARCEVNSLYSSSDTGGLSARLPKNWKKHFEYKSSSKYGGLLWSQRLLFLELMWNIQWNIYFKLSINDGL